MGVSAGVPVPSGGGVPVPPPPATLVCSAIIVSSAGGGVGVAIDCGVHIGAVVGCQSIGADVACGGGVGVAGW